MNTLYEGFPGGTSGKEPAWVGKIPWNRAWQRFQYSCLDNPMARGTWQATVHRATKNWMQLSTHALYVKRNEHLE